MPYGSFLKNKDSLATKYSVEDVIVNAYFRWSRRRGMVGFLPWSLSNLAATHVLNLSFIQAEETLVLGVGYLLRYGREGRRCCGAGGGVPSDALT
jgi:hypothetical protein